LNCGKDMPASGLPHAGSGPRPSHGKNRRSRERGQTVLQAFQRDHENIQSEFEGFQTAGGEDRYYLANRLLRELELHVTVAAEVLYPAVQARIEQQSDRKAGTVMRGLWREHQALQTLLARVNECRTHDDGFVGQIDGLMQHVQRYTDLEERDLFPLAQAVLGEPGLLRLKARFEERREELDHRLAV
jgi:Hemerythrin HHE cation binding domain